MQRLLFHRDPHSVAPTLIKVPRDAVALQHFQSLATDDLAVEVVEPRPTRASQAAAGVSPTLRVAALHRGLDTTWRRTSYSALTAAAHDVPHLGSEPEHAVKDDEIDVEEVHEAAGTVEERLRQVPSAWHALPGGTGFGAPVHAVLEQADDLGDEPATRAGRTPGLTLRGPRRRPAD